MYQELSETKMLLSYAVLLILIAPIQCSISLMMRSVLNEQNKHRKNGGMSDLRWDEALERKAYNYVTTLCQHSSSSLPSQQPNSDDMISGSVTTQESTSSEQVATDILSDLYYKATRSYSFGGQDAPYYDCSDKSSSFEQGAAFLVKWIRPDVKKVGCEVKECGRYHYLFACSYWPPMNKSFTGALFTNDNFLTLCVSEKGQWRSCRMRLDRQCSSGAKGQNRTDYDSTSYTQKLVMKPRLLFTASFILSESIKLVVQAYDW
ncbi:uncharacterized protein LOC142340167 [Convolutriloba macropyga]|uniref:uncharacterized protein LOC142340167 n=1 Tax=Convolutriloba macropyga TaxID=536237 RepID=UPI003F5206E6